jgi:hypothetical protein
MDIGSKWKPYSGFQKWKISRTASNTLSERKSFLVFDDSKNGSCGYKLNKLIDVCKRDRIVLNSIARAEEKNATLDESTEDKLHIGQIKVKQIELKLTPPIITAWTYQLANGLHKGK